MKTDQVIKLIRAGKKRLELGGYETNKIYIGLHKPGEQVVREKFSIKETKLIKKYLQSKTNYELYQISFDTKDNAIIGYKPENNVLKLRVIIVRQPYKYWTKYKGEKFAAFPVYDILEIK